MLTRPVRQQRRGAQSQIQTWCWCQRKRSAESLPLKAHNRLSDNDLVITLNPSNSFRGTLTGNCEGVIGDARRFALEGRIKWQAKRRCFERLDQEIAAESLDEIRVPQPLPCSPYWRSRLLRSKKTLQLQNLDVHRILVMRQPSSVNCVAGR